MVSNKEIRDAKNFSAIPLSNENIKKKRNNLLKSVIGASVIATGLTMMPQASFAQVAEQPPAIVQKEAAAEQASSGNATEAASSEAPVSAKKDEVTEAVAVDSGIDASSAVPESQGTEAQETAAPAENATTPEAGLEIGKEQSPEAQQGAETEPNYGEDEKKIKDYSGSERYKDCLLYTSPSPRDS